MKLVINLSSIECSGLGRAAAAQSIAANSAPEIAADQTPARSEPSGDKCDAGRPGPVAENGQPLNAAEPAALRRRTGERDARRSVVLCRRRREIFHLAESPS